jgi:hypothetical protein
MGMGVHVRLLARTSSSSPSGCFSARAKCKEAQKRRAIPERTKTLRRQPYFQAARSMELKAEKLGADVFADVASIITVRKFDLSSVSRKTESYAWMNFAFLNVSILRRGISLPPTDA